jgi:energy-coupling factor transporter transmembrane protein EcfT
LIYLLAIGLLGANWLMLGELNLKMRIRTGAILSLLLFALPFHFLFSHNGFFLILFITAFSLAVVHLVFVIKERRRKSVLWIPYLLILSWGLFHFFYALQPYFALQMANAYRYRTLCKFLSKEEAGVVLTDDLLFSFQCPSRVVLLRRPILSSRTLYDAICEVEPTHLLVQEALLPYLQELWLSYSVVDQFTLPSSNHSRVLLIRIDPSRLSCSHWKGRRR